MTEQKIQNNWYNNIIHLTIQFIVSWLAVGYVRIHLLKIPYRVWCGHKYDFIATFICMLFLFLLYKKVSLKVTTSQLITGIISCLIVWALTTRVGILLVMDWLDTIHHPYVETAKFYACLFFMAPLITYLLAFVNKNAFLIITYIYIILGILSIAYFAL